MAIQIGAEKAHGSLVKPPIASGRNSTCISIPLVTHPERGQKLSINHASGHERKKLQEGAGNFAVSSTLFAALHASQADQVLADDVGERVPGEVNACLQFGQDDLAR